MALRATKLNEDAPQPRGAKLRLCVRASARTGAGAFADESPRIPHKTASAAE